MRGRRAGIELKKTVLQKGLGGTEPFGTAVIVFHEETPIGAGLQRAPANHIGGLDDRVTDYQQYIPGAVVVIALGFPLYCADRLLVGPRVRPAHGDAAGLQRIDKALQVFLGFFNNLVRKGALGNVRKITIGVLGQTGAGIRKGKAGAKGVAHDDFLEWIPLVTTPDLGH